MCFIVFWFALCMFAVPLLCKCLENVWGISGMGGQSLKDINDILFLAGVGGDMFECVCVCQLCLRFGGLLGGADTTHSVTRPCGKSACFRVCFSVCAV